MLALGARFEITRSGPDGEPRWFYEAQPSMREALRRYRQGIDLTRPGMQGAFIKAIMRAKSVEAPR